MQTVAWRIIHSTVFLQINNTQGAFILNAVNYIYNNIDKITADYNAGVVITGDEIFQNGRFGPFKIAENILFNDIEFDLSGEHAEFENQAGGKVNKVKPGEQFFVRGTDKNFKFIVTASESQQVGYIDDHRFYIEINDDKPPYSYQPLFQEIANPEPRTYFYTAHRYLTIP